MGLLFGILTNILGGMSFALTKLALEGWPPVTLVAARLLVSAPLVAATAPRGWAASATRGDWLRLALIGVLGLAAPHLLGTYGLAATDSMNGAILVGLEPVGILVLARIFLGESIGAKQALGVLVGLAGGVLVVAQGDLRLVFSAGTTAQGSLLLALHSLLWAVYTVGAKPTLRRVPASGVTVVTTLIALAVVAPFSAHEWPSLDPDRALAPRALAGLLGLAIGVSGLATVLWNGALRELSASQMAVLIFLQPVAGMLLGAALGEPLPPRTLGAALLVFAGVWLSQAPTASAPSERHGTG